MVGDSLFIIQVQIICTPLALKCSLSLNQISYLKIKGFKQLQLVKYLIVYQLWISSANMNFLSIVICGCTANNAGDVPEASKSISANNCKAE